MRVTVLRVLPLGVLLVLLMAASAQARSRQVVLLQSSERGNVVLDRFTAALRVALDTQSPEPVVFTEFVVNPSGFIDPPDQAIAAYLRSALAGRRVPDLVITVGGPAAAFTRRHRTTLFPDSPVLYAATDQRFLSSGTFGDRETVVAVANDQAATIDDALQLLPGTEHVFIVIGTGVLGQFWRAYFDRDFADLRARLRITATENMSYGKILDTASALPPRSIVFFHSFDHDTEGVAYPSERVIADLRERANAPVFSSQSAELGRGPVGGRLMSTDDVAASAASAALKILGGMSPALVKTPTQQRGAPVYDWRELQRWGISESRLPPGSVVLFREPGIWERSKWTIIAGASVLVAQSALIAALLVSRRKRRRAELSLRESEGRFRVLANAAPVMIRMSDADGLAGDFNVKWLEFTGRTLEDELGNGWMNAIHPDDLAACRLARRQSIEARTPFRMEYRLRRADGEYRWVLDSVQPRFTRDGQFVGLIGSAIDITELKAARSALSNLNQRLMQAQEQERARVARELHDDVCQQIAVFTLDLEHLREQIPGTDAETRRRAAELCEGVRTLGDDVRAISHRLHSSKLEFLGLPAAAGSLCREVASSHHLAVDYEQENVPARLADTIALSVFRVLQEAMSNVVKHSGATHCRVTLRATDDELRLDVSDNGRGFDIQSAVAHAGLGLVSMQERLRLVNGRIAIDSRPGEGTTLRATVPLRQDPSPSTDPLRAMSATE